MATKLKKMRLTSVDLVRAGANQEADICLYKSAEAAEQPTEEERNIFKRFIHWFRENTAEGNAEPESGIEKQSPLKNDADLETIYKSSIIESLHSITADDSLTTDEKLNMIVKSIDQYNSAMEALDQEEPAAPDDVEKKDWIDEIEEV